MAPNCGVGGIESIERDDSGFTVTLDGESIRTRFVILSTGVEDHLPPLPGAAEALLRGVLRVCPICDGLRRSVSVLQ